MTKKLWIMLSVLLMAALVLVACGGDDTTEEPTEPEPTEAPADEPEEEMEEEMEEPTEEPMEEEAAEPTEEPMEEPEPTAVPEEEAEAEPTDTVPEVAITIWADDTRAPVLLDLAEEFEAEYGVALVVEQVADIRDQFTIAAPAGEGPDIIVGAHDWLGQLVGSGLLAPIDLGDKADAFTDVTIDGFTYQGELYGMPYASENLAFFYNTELVETPPTTWEEVVTIGTELQEAGDVTYGFALSGTTYDMFPLQTAFGGYIFGQDDAGNYDPTDVGVDSEGMIATGEWLQARLDEGFMDASTDWDTAHTLFENGEVPFIMAGPWALDRFRDSGVPYAVTTFPAATAEGRPFAGIQGFMVNSLSENVLLAQTFLTEFVATDETMQALYEAGNRPSAFTSVLEATEDPDISAFGEAGSDAVLMPAIPEMGSVWGSWGDAFTLILNGDETPEAALTTAAEQIRSLIAGES